MIDLERNVRRFQGTDSEIISWIVWFQTPFGLYEKLGDAVTRVKECDMDPNFTVVPVVVAWTENQQYEIVQR